MTDYKTFIGYGWYADTDDEGTLIPQTIVIMAQSKAKAADILSRYENTFYASFDGNNEEVVDKLPPCYVELSIEHITELLIDKFPDLFDTEEDIHDPEFCITTFDLDDLDQVCAFLEDNSIVKAVTAKDEREYPWIKDYRDKIILEKLAQ